MKFICYKEIYGVLYEVLQGKSGTMYFKKNHKKGEIKNE